MAKAKAVTVSAGPDCTANASMMTVRFDPDGDPLVITQSPRWSLSVGNNKRSTKVMDPRGATSQASATVTVVDTTGPDVSDVSASPNSLWPPNHQMVPVTVSYATSDNCSGVNCVLSVSSNEPVNGQGDGDIAPDWVIVDDHHILLRAERAGKGNGRVYTIRIDCSDGAGNHTIRTVTVRVPKSQGG